MRVKMLTVKNLKAFAKTVKKYRVKRLITPHELRGVFEGVKENARYVAIPTKLFEKHAVVEVRFGDEFMLIFRGDEPLGYRRFPDKFGRNTFYTLAYFEWKPKDKIKRSSYARNKIKVTS